MSNKPFHFLTHQRTPVHKPTFFKRQLPVSKYDLALGVNVSDLEVSPLSLYILLNAGRH